ncbi:hypothetical protein [Globicatella sanguinis]
MRPTQLCGGRPTKRKLFNFQLLVYSQILCSAFSYLYSIKTSLLKVFEHNPININLITS